MNNTKIIDKNGNIVQYITIDKENCYIITTDPNGKVLDTQPFGKAITNIQEHQEQIKNINNIKKDIEDIEKITTSIGWMSFVIIAILLIILHEVFNIRKEIYHIKNKDKNQEL